jgi:CBS domain-containing protein
MLENGVNSVLITDHQKLVGVVNDRDVLKAIVEQQKDAGKSVAKDLDFTPLIILHGNESMITAMKIMTEKGIRRGAMVKNGQLVGMMTEAAAKKAALQVNPSVA